MSEEGGVWRTIGGRRVFIKDGEDLATDMKQSGKFNSNKKEKNSNKTDEEEIKEKQFEIIQKNNPMQDDYHTGIRSKEDIKSPTEAFKTKINEDEDYIYPDFSKEDGLKALETGKIKIYSSKEIKQGSFVSTSKMMAQDYAGSGQVYEKIIDINDVAWIDSNEGQYAEIKKKK